MEKIDKFRDPNMLTSTTELQTLLIEKIWAYHILIQKDIDADHIDTTVPRHSIVAAIVASVNSADDLAKLPALLDKKIATFDENRLCNSQISQIQDLIGNIQTLDAEDIKAVVVQELGKLAANRKDGDCRLKIGIVAGLEKALVDANKGKVLK